MIPALNRSPQANPPRSKDALQDGPLLALETTGRSASVAIEWPDGRIVSATTPPSLSSARALAPAIESLLKANAVSTRQLAAIAVTIGPGSFTGLRVGVTLAKSMAYALRIPTLAVDSLETMAWAIALSTFKAPPSGEHSLAPSGEPRFVWTVLDAYRGELFAAFWRIHPLGSPATCDSIVPARLVESAAWTASFLDESVALAEVSPLPATCFQRPVVLVGPGLQRCKGLLDAASDRGLTMFPDQGPHAAMVAKIGRQKLVAGEATDAFRLMPAYLRGSAAEEKRNRNQDLRA